MPPLLANICDNSRTLRDRKAKLSVSFPTSILHLLNKKIEPSFLDDVTGSIFLDPCTANFDGTGGKLHDLDLDL